MKSKILILMGVIFLLTSAKALFSEEFTGYLSDVLCGTTGYVDGYQGNEKFNLTKNPEKNNLMCLTMDNCKKTGYGIFIKQKDGGYKFIKFDKKGSDLAIKEILDKAKDKKANAPQISVDGTLKDGIITVIKIKELKPSAKTTSADDNQNMKM